MDTKLKGLTSGGILCSEKPQESLMGSQEVIRCKTGVHTEAEQFRCHHWYSSCHPLSRAEEQGCEKGNNGGGRERQQFKQRAARNLWRECHGDFLYGNTSNCVRREIPVSPLTSSSWPLHSRQGLSHCWPHGQPKFNPSSPYPLGFLETIPTTAPSTTPTTTKPLTVPQWHQRAVFKSSGKKMCFIV